MSNFQDPKLSKDGKTSAKPGNLKASSLVIPGFGKGAMVAQKEGNWTTAVSCINGDNKRKLEAKLSKGITYFGGSKIASPSDSTLYLPDGNTIDANFIFPWDPTDADPLRLGGGIVTGIIIEGAQRKSAGPKDPMQAPFLNTTWANGAPYSISIFVEPAFGITFYPGDSAFALVLLDPVTRQYVIKAVAKADGDCLATAV